MIVAGPKDFFSVQPTSVGAEGYLDTLITVTEYYEDTATLKASEKVNLDTINQQYIAGAL